MVELETKITESGVLYVPKEIRQCFGRKMKIIPNATAAVFFPADANYEDNHGRPGAQDTLKKERGNPPWLDVTVLKVQNGCQLRAYSASAISGKQ